MFAQYEHHGTMVWVRSELMGKHRDHCLCFACSRFKPELREDNCDIANAIFSNCVKYDVVTPVYECPEFEEDK